MAVQPIPEGYHSATSYLIVNGAARALMLGCETQWDLLNDGGWKPAKALPHGENSQHSMCENGCFLGS